MRSAEAADRLGINRSTLTRWVEVGRIKPAFVVPGYRGHFLFSPVEVDRLERELLIRKATKQQIAELKQQLRAS